MNSNINNFNENINTWKIGPAIAVAETDLDRDYQLLPDPCHKTLELRSIGTIEVSEEPYSLEEAIHTTFDIIRDRLFSHRSIQNKIKRKRPRTLCEIIEANPIIPDGTAPALDNPNTNPFTQGGFV